MKTTPFSRFIRLIEFDQSVITLEKELAIADNAFEQLRQTLETLTSDIEKERAHVRDLRKNVDAQELHMKTLDQDEKVARERATLALTPREYQGLKKESDNLKQQQHEHEEVLMAAWNSLEQAQKMLVVKEQTVKEQQRLLQEQMNQLDETQKKLLDQIDEHDQGRKEYQQDIPQDWLDKYGRMRNTVKNPVVPLVAGTCGACSCTITSQVMMQLDQNKMITCSSCYRLIYKNFEDNSSHSEKKQ